MPAISYTNRKSQNLSTTIEKIYGFKLSGDADKALKLASETFTAILDFDLANILDLENDTFIEQHTNLGFSLPYLELLSKFIQNTAEIFSSINKPNEATNLHTKGTLLLKFIAENDKTFSTERDELIKAWDKKIKLTEQQ